MGMWVLSITESPGLSAERKGKKKKKKLNSQSFLGKGLTEHLTSYSLSVWCVAESGHQKKDCYKFKFPSWMTALSGQRGLHNSMKLWAMPCRATQDRQVIVKSSDRTRSTGGGSNNPLQYSWGFTDGSDGKESACNAGDLGLIPESGRYPGEEIKPTPIFLPGEEVPSGLQSTGLQRVWHNWVTFTFQYFYLENPMDCMKR